MIPKRWAILVVGLVLCFSNGCSNNSSLATSRPTEVPINLVTGESFTCWKSPTPQDTKNYNQEPGSLLVFFDADSVARLYQLNLTTLKYELLISNMISEYRRSYLISHLSPNERYVVYEVVGKVENWIEYSGGTFVYNLGDKSSQFIPGSAPDTQRWFDIVQDIGWSADGECLMAWRYDGQAIAYRIKDNIFQERSFIGAQFAEVNPSPNGLWWAWIQSRDVVIMSPDGQWSDHEILHMSIDPISNKKRWAGLIRWSPNGHTLAFAYASNNYQYPTFDSVRLVEIKENRIVSYESLPISVRRVDDLKWSRDGSQLLIMGTEVEIYNLLTDQFQMLNISINLDSYPVWSPSGNRVAFVGEDHQLYIMNIGNGEIAKFLYPSDVDPTEYRITRIDWVAMQPEQ